MHIEVYSSGPVETNSILLACSKTKKATIIDVPFGSSEPLLDRLKSLGFHLEKILLTHSHWDHIAEVSLLKEATSAPVYVHSEDAGNLENPGSDGLPQWIPFSGVKPDGYLFDGQEISLGELTLRVIHTPGHTPGGVCFYLEKEGVLISGDTLFKGAIGNLSFPTARPVLMRGSLKKLMQLPASTRVIPGHGDETTIGEEEKFLL